MGEIQGKKVVSDGVAYQTIEALPVFGQIKPSWRPGASRAETQSWEKKWLISVTMYKRSKQLGVEKETQYGKWRSRCPERLPRARSLHVYAEPDRDRLQQSGCSEEGLVSEKSSKQFAALNERDAFGRQPLEF